MSQLTVKFFFVCLALVTGPISTIYAQRIKLASGSLNGLKAQKSYDVKFTYDSMIVGESMPEREYLQKKKKEWEQKEPGKGSAFVNQWFDDREILYEPAFRKNFEKYSKVRLGDKGAPYTLILKTKRTEGGWDVGVMGHPGEIDGELWIVATADPARVIAKIHFHELPGKNSDGGDFKMTTRIQSAYEIAGKGLADFIRRKSR
jgi:hypothetical protein